MANASSALRTNYFHVDDAGEFLAFMQTVVSDGDAIEIWEKKDSEGEKVFAFGTHGCIVGITDDPENAGGEAFDAFIAGLQDYVSFGDAIIIMEAGFEKLKGVYGQATVVTCTDTEYIDLQGAASDKALDMIHDQLWDLENRII